MCDNLLEDLACLEHLQWCEWSKSVAGDLDRLIGLIDLDKLDRDDYEFIQSQIQRLKRWESYWIDYDELSDDVKEQDRAYARKTIKKLNGK